VSAIIRPFALPDEAFLREVVNAVCAEGRWMSTPRFEPTPAWTHALEAPAWLRYLLLVVADKGRIVGWCRLFPSPECNGQASEGELGIGLLPEYRGRGLGGALIGQTFGWAGAIGMERVALTTRVNNFRAIHLFERCGFIPTGREVDGWMEMACQLPSWRGQANDQ
jgi:RimJ/RimL family protein N-acetyltransferase